MRGRERERERERERDSDLERDRVSKRERFNMVLHSLKDVIREIRSTSLYVGAPTQRPGLRNK